MELRYHTESPKHPTPPQTPEFWGTMEVYVIDASGRAIHIIPGMYCREVERLKNFDLILISSTRDKNLIDAPEIVRALTDKHVPRTITVFGHVGLISKELFEHGAIRACDRCAVQAWIPGKGFQSISRPRWDLERGSPWPTYNDPLWTS